jgi:hypothetical protein
LQFPPSSSSSSSSSSWSHGDAGKSRGQRDGPGSAEPLSIGDHPCLQRHVVDSCRRRLRAFRVFSVFGCSGAGRTCRDRRRAARWRVPVRHPGLSPSPFPRGCLPRPPPKRRGKGDRTGM